MKKVWLLLPFTFVFALIVVFFFALRDETDSSILESALLNQPLPERPLKLLDGDEMINLAEVAQDGPFLLNIWGTWCPACRTEHPVLNELAAQGIRIVGVNYKDEPLAAKKWLIELHNPYFLNVEDPIGNYGLDLGVYGAPETYFIDGQGIIRHRVVGEVTRTMWREELQSIWESL
ncbi:DsbE family thiol:disulfide interchange protein [Salinibius halmophilus]|uniref:DsbE family thiol:disulfide interchange protein n=1 Tax=Salinibius halmophilus TaxID=1853216 RepID=UPI000E6760CC|nr:DsbE family thiol:disulfide interchange protein [Salinibius halmophilus]